MVKPFEEPVLTDDNENMCLMYPQRSPSTRRTSTSRHYREAGEASLLSPPEQFVDTNYSNNCFLKTSELDIEKLYLSNDHNKPQCPTLIPKTANNFHQTDPQNFTSLIYVSQISGPQEYGSISNNQLPSKVCLKLEDKMKPQI